MSLTDQELSILSAAAEGPPPECWQAIRKLGEFGGAESLVTLRRLTESPDEYRRSAAVLAIGLHASGTTVTELIRACLRDDSEYVVRAACEAIALLRDSRAAPALIQLLDVDNPLTRMAALRALRDVWGEYAFEPVMQAHQSDPDESVRREAAWTLTASTEPSNWERLVRAWTKGELARYRVWACMFAKMHGAPEALACIEHLARDPDGHVRRAASEALRRDSLSA